jgi:hypothetical protein
VPETDDDNIREILHKRFRMIYQLTKKDVEILTVIHASRLLDL